jgi:hypothetical protein
MREIPISGCNSTERNIVVVEQNSQVKHIVCKARIKHVTVGHCCCEVGDGEHQAQDYEIPDREEGKGKAVPLQACSGPEGSRKLRFPDLMTTTQEGGKVVSLRHRPHSPPGNSPGNQVEA